MRFLRGLLARGVLPATCWCAVLGCGSDAADERADPPVEEPEPAAPVYLSVRERLVRISTALRGVRPSPAELARVDEDESALDGIVTEYLEDAGFGEMVRDVFNEALNVRAGAGIYPAGYPAVGALAGEDVQQINTSVTEAPLRLIEYVVRYDRPLTEIVTASYTLADRFVASVWGLPHSGADGWEVTEYEDGRDHAGILSDSWLFTRHSTTFSNKNRGRANAVARSLLCFDFLSRRIDADATINLADEEEVANAVRENESCASCHQTLDPLAAHFSAFLSIYVPAQIKGYPFDFYLPEASSLFEVREPGYFGYEGGGLSHLGASIAADPRFSRCMAERFYAYLHQTRLGEAPPQRLAQLQSILTESWNAKELVSAIVLGDDFRTIEGGTVPGERSTLLKVRPWQLARLVEDLTGYRWRTRVDFDLGNGNLGLVDMLSDSLFGFEVLAGGIDSVNVTLPAHTMTASSSLVLRGLAERAANAAVEADLVDGYPPKLFTSIRPGDISEAAVREQIEALLARLYGVAEAPGSEEVTRAYALFTAAYAHSGSDNRAWKTTLLAFLQDPRLVYY